MRGGECQMAAEKQILTEQSIGSLPPAVQNWLWRSNVIGKEIVKDVRLHQRGEMRTRPNGKWMRFEAEQYINVENPAFSWRAKVKAAPFITLKGRDQYIDGKGEMLIKLLNIIPVMNAKGVEIDNGALMRYMAEMVWYPSAAIADYCTWVQAGALQAKVTINHGGMSSSGVFNFNNEGDVQSFEAMRYFQQKTGATLEKWDIQLDSSAFKEFDGIRIPSKATVTWKLKDSDFTWLRLEITCLKNNVLKA
jgi:hypothetical protein